MQGFDRSGLLYRIRNAGGGSGGGKLGQVVQTVVYGDTSTSSGSDVDISGMSVSITPAATTSKVLIFFQIYVCGAPTANSPISLLRGTTKIAINDPADFIVPFRQPDDGQSIYRLFNLSSHFMDEPSTGSATTYKLQWKTNSGTLYLNRPVNDGGLGANVSATSIITAMEILA